MEKFSNLKKQNEEDAQQPKKDDSKFKNNDFEVIEYDESDIIISKNELIVLPYLKDDGFILMKYEKVPAFSYKYKDAGNKLAGYQFFLSCIRSVMDDKENDVQNVRRALYEETGLVLSTNVAIEIDKILFKNNINVGQYYFCQLNLSYSDYKQTSLKTDNENRVIKVSLGDLDEIKSYDLITDYMILRFKYDVNI